MTASSSSSVPTGVAQQQQQQVAQHQQGVSTALVHSVVVLSISDQWTRMRVQTAEGSEITVCGALLGKHTGRDIEIWNSFDIKFAVDPESGHTVVDDEYYINRSLLYKETFPELEFIGFYVTGDHEQPTDNDMALQRQALAHSEAPLLLKLNAQAPVLSDKLAIAVFDSMVDPSDDRRFLFQPIPVKIVSESAEQIGLSHLARCSKGGTAVESTATKHLGAQFGAINAFIRGLAIANDYVKAVQEGKLERDEEILREIHKLCLKLTVHGNREESQRDKLQSCDQKLLVLLTAVCSAQGAMFKLVDRVNLLARERLHFERSSFLHFPHGFGGRLGPFHGAPFGSSAFSRFFL